MEPFCGYFHSLYFVFACEFVVHHCRRRRQLTDVSSGRMILIILERIDKIFVCFFRLLVLRMKPRNARTFRIPKTANRGNNTTKSMIRRLCHLFFVLVTALTFKDYSILFPKQYKGFCIDFVQMSIKFERNSRDSKHLDIFVLPVIQKKDPNKK